MNEKWKKEFDKALEETVRLLDELKQLGYSYKCAANFRFTECDHPMWEALNEEEGTVTIDPNEHGPRCIAHEMGHGFHECLRRDYPDWWVSHESETVAETIRFFVELRMNTGTKNRWLPRAKHSKVIETCDYSLGGPTGFTNLLRNRLSIEQVEKVSLILPPDPKISDPNPTSPKPSRSPFLHPGNNCRITCY